MEASIRKRDLYTEIEQNAQVAAKRLWKVVRIVFCVLKTGTVKNKLMLDLNLMLKRGNKAITNLRRRRSSITGGADVTSSARVRDYEFSCSNTPANDPFAYMCKRKRRVHGGMDKEDAVTEAVKKVFELLGENDTNAAAMVGAAAGESPLMAFPGVRVTDSPFPLDDGGDHDHVVDKAAEEFIKKFYKNLKLQKKMGNALESPYHDGWVR
ncbi:hypothetical protein Bca4012_080563 [Brassica carinata]|uniref:Avr9/Cf-9 rapidly elicited protein 146 n=3 Tax=Brassica TaxID=3705 RepID=A0A8X7TDK5_BRACI|nr:uncharacterized protein LOC106364217 [Brassica napus]KAG2238110.1 hypothetical protein Bca52824_092630 [Brassica carinata]CAF2029628.1 unnamed protein product [Brassica napus]VDD40587.1 unnamed protein product [Brassica oleracea]